MRAGRRNHGIIKPGKRDGAFALADEARKVFERFGAETRVTLGGAGTPANSMYFNFEAGSATELGGVLDQFFTDSDGLSVQTRLAAADSPFEGRELTAYDIIDLGIPEGPRGRIGNSVVWRASPGKADNALGLAKDAADQLIRLGACRSRVAAIGSGENVGAFVSVTEYESFREQGRVRDALATDSDWQKLTQKLQGKDAPGTFLGIFEWLEPPS
jgi:hypothetical protein